MKSLVTMLVLMIFSQIREVQAAHSSYFSQKTGELVSYKFSL